MSGIRGRIIIIAEALEPIHHGGDKSGNEVLYRTAPVWVDGVAEDVPIVSGNAVKHLNREGASRFALAATGIDDDGDLTREEINLLFSGGTLTKSGQTVKLSEAREVEKALPGLGLHGYACGNVMQEAQVAFSSLELLCDATQHKHRETVETYAPEFLDRFDDTPDDYLRGYFGTNHEPSRRRGMRDLMHPDVREALEKSVSDGDDKSSQMIFGYQCLIPGSVLVGSITLKNGVRPQELQALRSGFWWPTEGQGPRGGVLLRFGGKGSTGHGLCEVRFFGQVVEGLEAPRFVDTQAIAPAEANGDEELQAYIASLKSRRDEIRESLKEVLK